MSYIQDHQKQFADELFLLCLMPRTSYSGDEGCVVHHPFRYRNLFHQLEATVFIALVLAKQH
jgi:hypothetical protein